MRKICLQEVWFAEFPFEEDESKTKERPVIVLAVDDDTCEVLSMKVTSAKSRSEFEIEIFDRADIPLDHKSNAVISDVRSIQKRDFRRKNRKV